MSFKPYTEEIKKKIGIGSSLGRIRIHYPGSGSASKLYGSKTLPLWIPFLTFFTLGMNSPADYSEITPSISIRKKVSK